MRSVIVSIEGMLGWMSFRVEKGVAMTSPDDTGSGTQDALPRPQLLHDFRMEDVGFEIVELARGDVIERTARLSGHFYYVMNGRLKGTQDGGAALWANDRDTLVVTGFVGHRIEAMTPTQVLVGSEPYKHLDWLSRNLTMICVPGREQDPLVYRLHLVIALIIDEISNPEFQPDQLTLERAAELTLFYFLRISNPSANELDPYPWNDRRLMSTIEAMNAQPSDRWTVDLLAKRVHMSRSAFALHYKQTVGEAPMHTLTRIRLRTAAMKMLQGESILSAAQQVGYGSGEAFGRAFHRQFGTTPGRWMRKQSP